MAMMEIDVKRQLEALEAQLDACKAKMAELDAKAKAANAEMNEKARALAMNALRLEGGIMALKVSLGAEVPQ